MVAVSDREILIMGGEGNSGHESDCFLLDTETSTLSKQSILSTGLDCLQFSSWSNQCYRTDGPASGTTEITALVQDENWNPFLINYSVQDGLLTKVVGGSVFKISCKNHWYDDFIFTYWSLYEKTTKKQFRIYASYHKLSKVFKIIVNSEAVYSSTNTNGKEVELEDSGLFPRVWVKDGISFKLDVDLANQTFILAVNQVSFDQLPIYTQ